MRQSCSLLTKAFKPQKAQKAQNDFLISFGSFCVFVPFVATPGKRPAAEFCKGLNQA